MIRVAIILGLVLALFGAVAAAVHSYGQSRFTAGEAACQKRHDDAALALRDQALNTADTQNKADERLGVASTEDVSRSRDATEQRRERAREQPITPPSMVAGGTADALVCPDYLADPWVRLFEQPADPPAAAPATVTGSAGGM